MFSKISASQYSATPFQNSVTDTPISANATASTASNTHKSGYQFALGDPPADFADQVMGSAAIRLSKNKAPYQLLLKDKDSIDEFKKSFAEYAKDPEMARILAIGNKMLDDSAYMPPLPPSKGKKHTAREVAEHNQAALAMKWTAAAYRYFTTTPEAIRVGSFSELNSDTSKLYLHAHGTRKSTGFYVHKSEETDQVSVKVTPKQLVQQFKELGLPPSFRDLRLVQCQSEKAAKALQKELASDFPKMQVSYYAGNLLTTVKPDARLPLGTLYHSVRVEGKFPTRRSPTRQQLEPAKNENPLD